MNLINFEFEPNQSFIPRPYTRKFGLYTHKSSEIVAGVTLPGLFQTTNLPFHLIGFFSVFVLEILAILWSFEEGSSIAIILWLAVLDIVLAVAAHLNYNSITLTKNHILTSSDNVTILNANNNIVTDNNTLTSNNVKIKENSINTNLKFRKKLSSLLLLRNFFYFLIILSAVGKFYFFFSIYFIFDAVSLLILFFYLLGAILHITCTGYAIFTMIFSILLKIDYSKYVNNNNNSYDINKPEEYNIETGGIQLTLLSEGKHKIVKSEDGKFKFQSFGILNDLQLRAMVNGQKDIHSQRIVAIEGVSVQIRQLG
jgi:hypothetical protein